MNEINLNDPYQPVSCDLYSQYELVIMHNNLLRLSWREHDEVITAENLIPLDIQTKNKAEFLIAKTTAQNILCIRLDHITEMHILK
jgi:Rho-binding antiterminator